MTIDAPRHPLSPEEFRLLRSLVHDYAGIYFHDEMRYILERRLGGRIDAASISNLETAAKGGDSKKVAREFLRQNRLI